MADLPDAPWAVSAAPARPLPGGNDAPWMVERRSQPRKASGVVDAIRAGYQGSVPGLIDRGKMPDVVLDPEHSKWYERLAATGTQMFNEVPEMVLGAIGGGAAGAPAGPIGSLAAGGALSFALPTAIRTALTEAYSKGEVLNSADFLSRTAVVLKATAKDAAVGALSTLAGLGAARAVGTALAPAIGTTMTVKTATTAIGAAGTTAELGALVVTPALLEGRLPEPRDFADAAILIGGIKGAAAITSKMRNIYAKTGVEPAQVVADAKADPTIALDMKPVETPLKSEAIATVYHGSPHTFDKFDVTKMGTGEGSQTYGRGLYFAENPAVAKAYRDSLSPDPQAGNTYTVHIPKRVIDSMLDLDLPFDRQPAAVKAAIEPFVTPLIKVYKSGSMSEMFQAVTRENGDAVASALQAAGVQGVRYLDQGSREAGSGSRNFVLFNADQARVVARNGEEVPRAYQALARADNARNAVPGEKATQFVEQPFATIPQAKGEPAAPSHVNYNFINTPDEVKGAMSRLSELYEVEINAQRRGTVSWEQTQVEAGRHLNEMLGGKTTEPRQPGTPAGAAEILARKQMALGAAEDLMRVRDEVIRKGTNATAEDTLRMLAAAERTAMIQAEFLGARAEAGRALNILKDSAVSADRAKKIQEILDAHGTDPQTLAKMLGEIDNPTGAFKFAEKLTKATTWQKVQEAWVAGLVSGPITQMANIMGNLTQMAVRPFVDAAAVPIGALRGGPDRVLAIEPLARTFGNLQATLDALKAAGAVLRTGEAPESAVKYDQPRLKAIEGVKGEIIRLPFRALSAGDVLFRTLNERGEAYALAVRAAHKEGHNPLSLEFRERVAELVNSPTPKMQEAMTETALRNTYQAPPGPVIKAMAGLVRAVPVTKFIFPFLTTPGNMIKEMARMTPLAPLVAEWRADIMKGGAARDKALGEIAVGASVSALAVSFVGAGMISGAGPTDPNEKRTKMAAGWQPYSVKIGDKWYNYQRMGVLGTIIGMTADMTAAYEHMGEDEQDQVAKIMAVGFGNAITNQTFLQGMTTLSRAITEPGRFGPKFVQQLAGSAVPGIAAQTAQLTDPWVREIDSISDAVMNRIPVAREQLLPQIDLFGKPIENKERTGVVSPITVTTESKDKVRTEAARLGVAVQKAPDAIQMRAGGDRKLGKVELTPEQQQVFAKVSGTAAYQVLDSYVNSPRWDDLPDMVKKQVYDKVFERARAQGRAEAITPEQRREEAQRIADVINGRMAR